ncbi:transcription factor SPT20 homolog isoform X1 [Pistacia vera]|uniref:transcription factor SPT20 homolog isoform X1 n=1 Tax=Pistacia vera TaxID=55513 RepID=UPI00126382E7|nr:transcription factor SPT20 homolog isoform X1 [Pistacia vera]XP_031256791.1 transcription factor SPT20 homolog isoform X1 [Pistacia vera]
MVYSSVFGHCIDNSLSLSLKIALFHGDDTFYYHAQRRRFENLMRLIESSCPSLLLRRKEIERHFSKLTHIPDHPPYAYMIQRAISELNELGGSSEVTISKFIEAEYEDLPFAHASLLTHHLQKLVKKGDIVCTSGNCYILTNESSDFHCNLNKEQKHLRRRCQKGRQHKFKGVESQKQKKIEESQEKTQVNGTICKGIEEQKPVEGHIGPTGEQENKGYAELIEKHNEVEEIQFKVNDEQVGAEQYNKGIDEHNQKQVQQKQHQKEMNLQQVQVLGKTSEVFVEENNQAEDKNQAENHNGVAEEGHKELDKEVIEEQQIQVPVEGYIGPIVEQENEGNAKLIEEHNELEEIQFKVNDEQVEAEQYNEGNEEHNQKQDQQKQQQKEMNLQQIQVLGKTSEVLVEENSQAEDRNQAESHTGVAEAEHLKELDKEVMEEQFHEERKLASLKRKIKFKIKKAKLAKSRSNYQKYKLKELWNGLIQNLVGRPTFSSQKRANLIW